MMPTQFEYLDTVGDYVRGAKSKDLQISFQKAAIEFRWREHPTRWSPDTIDAIVRTIIHAPAPLTAAISASIVNNQDRALAPMSLERDPHEADHDATLHRLAPNEIDDAEKAMELLSSYRQ